MKYDQLPAIFERFYGGGVTPETPSSKTWTYRTVTHRAHHDGQMWRRALGQRLYRLSHWFSGLADRVDPWHEDDEWYTAPPPDSVSITFKGPFTIDE